MKAKINRVIVFKKNYKKNEIILTEGLNIITGNSQTGKSAILEIVDYCLLKKISSIPKGVITENVILYCIILELENRKLILARKAFKDEERTRGKDQIFYNFVNLAFEEKDLNYEYFETRQEFYRPIKEVKEAILFELGSDIIQKIDIDEENKHRVSFRNVVSYIFQQQNLIASKHALFYRFEDSFKRNAIIEEFPVLTGITNQEYYKNLKKIEELKKEEKKLKKEENNLRNELSDKKIRLEELKSDIKIYMSNKYTCLIKKKNLI